MIIDFFTMIIVKEMAQCLIQHIKKNPDDYKNVIDHFVKYCKQKDDVLPTQDVIQYLKLTDNEKNEIEENIEKELYQLMEKYWNHIYPYIDNEVLLKLIKNNKKMFHEFTVLYMRHYDVNENRNDNDDKFIDSCKDNNINYVKDNIHKTHTKTIHEGLEWASSNGYHKLIKIILKNNVKPNDNCIKWACKNGHEKVVNLLLENSFLFSHEELEKLYSSYPNKEDRYEIIMKRLF